MSKPDFSAWTEEQLLPFFMEDGCEEHTAELIRRCGGGVWEIAHSCYLSREDKEDCFQETWFRVWRDKVKFQPDDKPEPVQRWINTIALYSARDLRNRDPQWRLWRKERRRETQQTSGDAAEAPNVVDKGAHVHDRPRPSKRFTRLNEELDDLVSLVDPLEDAQLNEFVNQLQTGIPELCPLQQAVLIFTDPRARGLGSHTGTFVADLLGLSGPSRVKVVIDKVIEALQGRGPTGR
jgi:RNA polymerase sigma factor (sigma-70 family)